MNQSLLKQCDAELIGTATLIFIEPMLGDAAAGVNYGSALLVPEKEING